MGRCTSLALFARSSAAQCQGQCSLGSVYIYIARRPASLPAGRLMCNEKARACSLCSPRLALWLSHSLMSLVLNQSRNETRHTVCAVCVINFIAARDQICVSDKTLQWIFALPLAACAHGKLHETLSCITRVKYI